MPITKSQVLREPGPYYTHNDMREDYIQKEHVLPYMLCFPQHVVGRACSGSTHRVHVLVVVVVFTLNRSFYSMTSAVPPVSFLILHPREIQIL